MLVGLGVGVGFAATYSDKGRHIVAGVERTGRVVGTLAVCINDYRRALRYPRDDEAEYRAQLSACHKRCAERALVAMEKNGSIFIKLGQHLSSLTYLLPPEWCTTFIPLQDRCPMSSIPSIEKLFVDDTGFPLSHFFSTFDPNPIGAASLAQVHRATLRDTGEQVAVKLQHPSLDEWVPLDLWLTSFTFATLKRWFPEYDLTWLAEEMEVSLPQELDFAREGENAVRARNYFASFAPELPVVVPRVLWAKRRILVLEYVTGARPDNLRYLDGHGIDRDEVSAALARIFNEMIFGNDAPLHCDPHGGNIAVRSRGRHGAFDIVLYDHGLYRDIPRALRRSYAHLWLAVLDGNEPEMRRWAHKVAGVGDEDFALFASAITGRDYGALTNPNGGILRQRDDKEREVIGAALGEGMLAQLVQLLGAVPRVLLLVLKTNDLTRSLDEGLQTRQGPARTFLILAHYASRTVYEEQLERIMGGDWRLAKVWELVRAWAGHARVEFKLNTFEMYLALRKIFGMGPLGV
ncbi:ABC1-domain-containing protein [Trichodelitschia bisporula]|uniref:ABC1-domain-containing protein n=1 Tax=Trichodelitschia bisporula TaxID=703511 RepID=A0A6G1HTF8_9PEZI|nr:ABC1-domain-containing protein [Trichodelitschia bisporula]